MRATRIFLLGMLAGAGVVSLANYGLKRSEPTQTVVADTAARTRQPQSDRTYPAPRHKEAQSTTAVPQSSPAAERGATRETFEPHTSAEWNALVGGMLEWQVAHRTGERLSAAQTDRLVSELARLREASLALQEAPAEPGDPAELRERLARTLTLVQVDEVFREELGVGVAEFVRDMNPDAVEDVSRLPQP
jgi:hypothetical protein